MLESIFNELQEMRGDLDRFLNDGTSGTTRFSSSTSEWVFLPPMETGWTDDSLNLRFVVPGVREKDLEMTVQGNQLVIRGERKTPEGFGNDGSTYHRLTYGKFERTVDLPNGLNLDKVDAYLHDGVLDIHIPFAEEQKPRKIQISAGKAPKALAA